MPVLHKDAAPELVAAVDRIEAVGDQCYSVLQLLRSSRNLAAWAVLTGVVAEAEAQQGRWGQDSPHLDAALINLGRTSALAVRWITAHAKPPSRLATNYRWTPALEAGVKEMAHVALQYHTFENCFPMWHRDRLLADLLMPNIVRFTVPRGTRDRQVSAWHKGFRPGEGKFQGTAGKRPAAEPLANEFLSIAHAARRTGKGRFTYTPTPSLFEALTAQYRERTDAMLRRADNLSLGDYTMYEFKRCYTSVLVLAGMHEHICWLWTKLGNPYPYSSGVMLQRSSTWAQSISSLSGLPRQQVATMLADLTTDPARAFDLRVQPFVPLDNTLALAPPFPLHSRWDENILRTISHRRPEIHAIAANEKEGEMRQALETSITRWPLQGPITLPAPLPDIDLVLDDAASKTLLLCELKWVRKPLRPLERLDRDREVDHGIDQLTKIKTFLTQHPDYLQGRLTSSLAEYEHVHYLLVARDHWPWREPGNGIAIVDYEPFRRVIQEHATVRDAVEELLQYAWLPMEERDFRVQYDRAIANGVAVESEVFYAINIARPLLDTHT